jgi:mitogen-activated protein kinase 7
MDYQLGHPVAVKRINQINSLLVARRTLRELRLLRHFHGHPNIIALQDIFRSPEANFDELYIAQELMDADLVHIVNCKFPLPEAHIRHFLYQLLCGLKALHSANVIHRDLKPGNILWRHSGELKICDFGLARGMGEAMDGADVTMTNYVATRWYRPPEILLYRAQYGKSLDIWSVGCILAELFGRKVFLPGQSAFEQLHLILQKLGTPAPEALARIQSSRSRAYIERLPHYTRQPLAHRFPHISPAGLDLLDRMLDFDPTTRITVDEALRHPYLAAHHDPRRETVYPVFDFAFDARCQTLLQLKSELLKEVAMFHLPSPSAGLAWKSNQLTADEQQSLSRQQQQQQQQGPQRNHSIPNNAFPDPVKTVHPAAQEPVSRTTAFFQSLPPIIKRRFSLPLRSKQGQPHNSSA